MSDSSVMFTGASRYASDFQSLLERAVAIASLPMIQLEASQQALEDESAALGSLNTKITAVTAAISSLNTAASQDAYSTAVSNASVLGATTGTGATSGTYTIEVTALGAYSTAMSKDGLTEVTDPATQNISSASSFTLTIAGVETVITPASNTLNALAAAINDADADVQATVVNIGSTASPDYRLAFQSTALDAVAMQLNDGTEDLFVAGAPNGSTATYKINGVDAQPSDSRTITVAPGLTATLVGEGTSTVTVSHSTTAISYALASLATAYNAAVDDLDLHRGEAGGALAGQSLISSVWESIRAVAQYASGSGDITSLADLGLTFDDEGKMSFDTATFSTATSGYYDELISFLGSADDSGFLMFATATMDGLQDETDGILTTAIDLNSEAVTDAEDRVADEQARIDELEESLTAQMVAADALIAALEQQALYISNLFEAMRIAAQSYAL